MPWVQDGFDMKWEDEIDYANRPDLAPPDGSSWSPSTDPNAQQGAGNWVSAPTAANAEPMGTDAPLPPPAAAAVTPAAMMSGGGSSYGTPGSFNVSESWPRFNAPALPTIAPIERPPAFSFDPYQAAQPFQYDSFAAPTIDQAQTEPGYAFARDEGLRALQNSRLGTLRTGGTMKDFIGWGHRFAEQNYGNVYNRAANTYGINRGNAFDNYSMNERNRAEGYDRNRSNAADAYKTNWGVNTDVYDRTAGTALDLWDRQFNSEVARFNPTFDAARLTFQDLYQRDRDKLDALTRVATAGAGA